MKKYDRVKIKIPYKDPLEANAGEHVDLDHKLVEHLIKSKKYKQFAQYLNEELLPYELNSPTPGMYTRDTLSELLNALILDRYPDIHVPESRDINDLSDLYALRDKVHPGLSQIMSKSGLTPKIEPFTDEKDIETKAGSYDSNTGVVKFNPFHRKKTATIVHELGHSVDDIVSKVKSGDISLEDFNEFVAKQPLKKQKTLRDMLNSPDDYENRTSGEDKTVTGRGYIPVSRSPSFEDYDWQSGEFKKDLITPSPLEKYKEVGGQHHIDRPFHYDNLKNFIHGDLPDIVENQPRFKKLTGLLKRS